ncbi:uncharacterized protein LOC141661063 [Apium graveolens]|uniref:uncharacterized protein LOC141661063 n=1 Tax=Apium graveolens TaxID=4045 RepID=UPI003D78F5DD
MPLRSIDNSSPYFKLFKKYPDLDNLRTFGCLCYVSTPKAHRTKFDSRANPGFFIGYPGNTKGYKVLDFHTQQIVVSRDVLFYETYFPFLFQSNSQSITTFPSAIYLPLVTPGSFTHTEIFPDIISDDNHPSDNLDLTVDLSPVVSPSQSATSEISEHFKIFEISLFDNAQRSPFPSNTTLVLTLNNPQPIRQSTRVHKPPDYIKDFLCHIVASTPHWCNLLQHSSLPGPHQCLISKICDIREPNSYHEASLPPLWTAAMSKEIDALNRNHTWDLVDLPMKKFTHELLDSCDFDLSKKVSTPLPLNLKLTGSDRNLLAVPELYRSLVGKLNFLTNTHPDLAYTVQSLSQFMQQPRTSHLSVLLHTLRYVSHTIGQGILPRADQQIKLQAFSDSDWAACVDSRKSVTGYILLLGSSPITWKSKKESTISRSSSEAEYRAMVSVASKITWIVHLLAELGVSDLKSVVLHCDSQSAIHNAKNPVFHERTKHIEI